MLAQGQALGILHFCRVERDDATMAEPSFLTLVETVANSIGLAIANLRLRETLRQQSIRDPLTGLFNRRYLDETLRREILRATRAGSTLGVIMLDIDYFKRFNDTYGHDAGDTVLATLGKFLQNQVRGDDIACRYGGEEFTLILPGASLEIVRERAERLRIGAQSLTMRVNGTQVETITLSLGVAAAPQHGDTADAVLQAADAALYRAKQRGRNCVQVAV
jgi:diguanylate cyclase (GGDEF)-like protein